jgi:hypothetical protein
MSQRNLLRVVIKFLAIPYRTLLLVSLVLAGVWYGFVKLIVRFSIGPTPALIMVWASAVVLFLAFFPHLLDKIKRVKIKDFELEQFVS